MFRNIFLEVLLQYRLFTFHGVEEMCKMLQDDVTPEQCPACFDTLHILLAGDGNMKWRKQKCQQNDDLPSRTDFFVDKTEANKFKTDHPTGSKKKTESDPECQHRYAAEQEGPKAKNLHCKGVFCVACSHDYPLRGVDIDNGEKYAYYHLLLLKVIKDGVVPETVLYDIACRFAPHLRKKSTDLRDALASARSSGDLEMADEEKQTVEGLAFAIGTFHAWAHQVLALSLSVVTACCCSHLLIHSVAILSPEMECILSTWVWARGR